MNSNSIPIEEVVEVSNMPIDEWRKVQLNYYSSTPPFDLVIRREIFHEIYGLLLEHNQNIWVTGGTVLGAIRDNDFIAWDDDIDFNMIEKDFLDVMYKVKDCLVQNGYIVRLSDDNDYPKMVTYKKGVKVAIGSLKESGKFLLRPAYRLPKEFFQVHKKISFTGIDVLMPYPPEKYLEYVYGSDWKIPREINDDAQLYTVKYLRRPILRVILKRLYLFVKKYL